MVREVRCVDGVLCCDFRHLALSFLDKVTSVEVGWAEAIMAQTDIRSVT